jgi:transposase
VAVIRVTVQGLGVQHELAALGRGDRGDNRDFAAELVRRPGLAFADALIRLKFSAGISTREIARRLGIAASTVRETLRRFEGAGLGWPLPDGMSDGDLEAALYANYGTKRGHRRHAEPDWPTVHRELKRKHVTLMIVWDEYIAANPGGYSYSRFCELYRGFGSKLSPTMRQTHTAGERLFVDYAGDGVPVVIDRLTGEIRKAQIFVAVLGASSFTFAHASWTQALPDWIDAHVRALEVVGGVPHLLVCDYVPGHVIRLMCPSRLCGLSPARHRFFL